MDHGEELARLEQFVDKLLTNYNVLKKECAGLQNRLQEKEKENIELLEQVDSLRSDKSDMHSRVTSLIGKIEDWEKSQNKKNDNGTSSKNAAANGSGETLSIFS